MDTINVVKNTTKDTILKSALKVFIAKGFAGASISQIAKTAEINQSLIYHHFQSKEDLWVCVKKYCVDGATTNFPPVRHDTLENFVHDLVEVRFSVYAKPNMRMLVHWQALEPDTSQFYGHGITPHPLFDIPDHIRALQVNKLVRSDQDLQVLSGIIFGLVSYAFFDFANSYNLSKNQRDSYKKLIREILIQSLKPRDKSNEIK
jgi:AcrR family transcriptional regulator